MTEERDERLESIYVEQAGRLWRALYAYAGDREVASDALAGPSPSSSDVEPAIRAPVRWIWRAAFRIAAGELKDRRMRAPDLPVATATVSLPTQELLVTLRLLPPRQRAALILHYYGGYKAREIADILGSTAATVRVHLSQGRRRLRRLLEEDDD